MIKRQGIKLIPALLALWLLFGCAPGPAKPYKETRFLLDTIVEITAFGANAPQAVQAAFAEMERVNNLMNMYDPHSEVARINAAAGKEPVAVSPDTFFVLERSLYFAALTNGAFDVTVGPLSEVWGIGKKGSDYVPPAAAIAAAQSLVNYRDVILDKTAGTVYLRRAGMKLDLGGVAKGYATDRAAAVLATQGIQSALVNAGGSIKVIGNKPDGTPWRIGVQHPRRSDGIIAKLELAPGATLETSGDYQRFVEKDGVRYHHLLDPSTGMPARKSISVTIYGESATDGDILSTAVFVLGPERGMALIESLPGVEGIIVTPPQQVLVSPGLTGRAVLADGG